MLKILKKSLLRKERLSLQVDEYELSRSQIESFDLMQKPENILPKSAFLRCFKEAVRNLQPKFKLSAEGFQMLQTSIEDTITDMFFIANMLSMSRKQQTINPGDI